MNTHLAKKGADKYSLSVVRLPVRGFEGTYRYYRVVVPASDGSQTRTFLLSYRLSLRLWTRYLSFDTKYKPVNTNVPLRSDTDGSSDINLYDMPGERCLPFRQAIKDAITRKQEGNDNRSTWIVSKSLYKLWLLTSHVSTELFADCFNESGILSSYCSNDPMDVCFGSSGTWQDVESKVEGGAGNPPFDKELITFMVRCFEKGVQGSEPYCRVVVLPVGDSYKVVNQINTLTSEGEILVSTTPGCFPFMNQQVLLSQDHLKSKPFKYQSIGIFVWCNREYLLKNRPPLDIEELYITWINKNLYNNDKVTVHRDAFLRAFPLDLRTADPLLGIFSQEIINCI